MSNKRENRQNLPFLPADIRITSAKRRKLNRWAFILTIIAFLSANYHLKPYFQQDPILKTAPSLKAIIIQENARLYPIPSTLSQKESIKAVVGEEVTITKQIEDWYQIKIQKGQYWIKSTGLLLEKHI